MRELEFVKVRKSYQSPTGDNLLALADFSMKIDSGKFVSVVGPSGCGKTTLLRMAAGLIPSDSGEIRLDGALHDSPSPKMSMVFQGIGLMPWKTIESNVALGMQLQAHRPKLNARGGRARPRDAGDGRAHRVRALLSLPALRRDAATGGTGARAGAPAGNPADGRAVRRARCADTDRAAGRAAHLVGAREEHRAVHHPRPRRGDLPFRLCRHHGAPARPDQTGAGREPAAPALQTTMRAPNRNSPGCAASPGKASRRSYDPVRYASGERAADERREVVPLQPWLELLPAGYRFGRCFPWRSGRSSA